MTITINHIATSTPSYFQGSKHPTVQVLVKSNTTYQDIKKSMLNGWTYYHLIDESITDDAYIAAVDDLFYNVTMDVVPDSLYFLEDEDEDGNEYAENVYMFFSVVNEEDE